jgi:2-keto-4-pentenoate hydratase/2-oxohepta-3-ene-1,7-dioic acid hydratase in catechol pathway
MKLVTTADGRLGIDGGAGIVDVAPVFVGDPRRPYTDPMVQLIERFPDLRSSLEAHASSADAVSLANAPLGAPLGRPRKMVNLATEHDTVDPGTKPPIDWFFKSPESVVGSGANVVLPPHYATGFYLEAELGVVMGRRSRDVDPDDVENAIFGYTLLLDVSATDVGRPGMGTYFGKSFDSFCPMGPAILVGASLQEVSSFEVHLTLNGDVVTRYRIGDLPHSIPELIADVSTFATLLPGDVVACGSPPAERFEIFDNDRVSAQIPAIGSLDVTIKDPLFRHRTRAA